MGKRDGAAQPIVRVDEIDVRGGQRLPQGTWAAYDLEWMREVWLNTLRRGLEDNPAAAEEIF